MNQLFCSWSGGKDCTLALDRFSKANPAAKITLLTMIKNDSKKTGAHDLSEAVLTRQAKAMGFEIQFGFAQNADYREKWLAEIKKLKTEGVTGGIFGDIDLQVHYDWITEVLNEVSLKVHMPLWKENRISLVEEILEKGYKAKIVSININTTPEKYLGLDLTNDVVEQMKKEGIDPSGEGGEFHSFIYDGPLFKKPLTFSTGKIEKIEHHLCMEIL